MESQQFKKILGGAYKVPAKNHIFDIVNSRIEKRRLFIFRTEAVGYSVATLVTLFTFKPALSYLASASAYTGFNDYIRLATSGSSIILSVWKDIFLSIVESFPVAEAVGVLVVLLAFLFTIRHTIIVFHNLKLYSEHTNLSHSIQSNTRDQSSSDNL